MAVFRDATVLSGEGDIASPREGFHLKVTGVPVKNLERNLNRDTYSTINLWVWLTSIFTPSEEVIHTIHVYL